MAALELNGSSSCAHVYQIISSIIPFDDQEKSQIKDALAWVKSGAPIFRIAKPDIPNKHLAASCVIFDEGASKILLVDHKNAKRWLPAGGHVEIDENPQETARRECLEELHIAADFWQPDPLFLTSTLTVGLTAGHTDVTLWYVLRGNSEIDYSFDADEFNGIKWFHFDDIPYENSDPHIQRFISKLISTITQLN